MTLHAVHPSRRWRRVQHHCQTTLLIGSLGVGLGLSGCGAIRDQEFECTGFDEQRTVAKADTQAILSQRRVPQSIDFHIRQDFVLVKSFRAPRQAQPGDPAAIGFALNAPKASISGNFDPNTGMLSYNESHEVRIADQDQITQSTGVYRCVAP